MMVYKYTSAKYALDLLRTGKITVTTLDEVNDPNEWIPFSTALSLTDGTNALCDRGRRAGLKKTFLNQPLYSNLKCNPNHPDCRDKVPMNGNE